MNTMNSTFYILYVCILAAQAYRKYNNCSPQKGEYCVQIRQCSFFSELLENAPVPRPPKIIKIIRNHECGFDKNEPKVCCNIVTNNITLRNAKQPQHITNHFNLRLLPRNDCGRISNNFLITNGQKTNPLEFPWMALLAYYTDVGIKFQCGGTVINDRYVLTAAHCITTTLVGVRLGEHNINTEPDCDALTDLCSSQIQDFYLEEVIIHQNYKAENKSENDIALIRLASPANFTQENVGPICLPIGEGATVNLDEKFAVVAGWGTTEKGYKSAELLKTTIPVIPLENCKRISGNYASLNHKQICAGGIFGRDSCSGDSGGPLKYVSYENGKPRYVQYGIVAYGPKNCGTPGLPGVYTNVTYYMTWILNSLMP